jgi:hypothetical protein
MDRIGIRIVTPEPDEVSDFRDGVGRVQLLDGART